MELGGVFDDDAGSAEMASVHGTLRSPNDLVSSPHQSTAASYTWGGADGGCKLTPLLIPREVSLLSSCCEIIVLNA